MMEKKRREVARNPLIRLISDERIQGIPRKSNRPKPGNSRSPALSLRRPEEIQISPRQHPGMTVEARIMAAASMGPYQQTSRI